MKNIEFKIGKIEWFDGEEGYVYCKETKKSYYLHKSSLDSVMPVFRSSTVYRYLPILFTVYTNLYMSQVDKTKLFSSIKDYPLDIQKQSGNHFGMAWNLLCEKLGSKQHKIFIE